MARTASFVGDHKAVALVRIDDAMYKNDKVAPGVYKLYKDATPTGRKETENRKQYKGIADGRTHSLTIGMRLDWKCKQYNVDDDSLVSVRVFEGKGYEILPLEQEAAVPAEANAEEQAPVEAVATDVTPDADEAPKKGKKGKKQAEEVAA